MERQGLITEQLLREDEQRNGSMQMLADAAEARKAGVHFTESARDYEKDVILRMRRVVRRCPVAKTETEGAPKCICCGFDAAPDTRDGSFCDSECQRCWDDETARIEKRELKRCDA